MPLADSILGDLSVQFPDCGELPGWALAYADAALRCGQHTTQIEENLVKKGLSQSLAREVIPKCLEVRIERAELSRKKRRTWNWVNRGAFVVALVAILVFVVSIELPAARLFRYQTPVIPFAFLMICELWGKNHSWNGSLARPVILALAGWFIILALTLGILGLAL